MLIIGLTGGIAMGKSTAARFYRAAHIPVFDADATVHQLQSRNGRAMPALRGAFPTAVGPNGLDRAALRRLVMADRQQLARLEAIMHPLVTEARQQFLARARRAGTPIVVLDIPLLFETGGDRRVDLIVTASAPPSVQFHRIRHERHLSDGEIKAILARQAPDRLRIRRADLVVRTGLSRYHAWRILKRHLIRLRTETN
jgi:dephospho-CoA kinase